jgi:hypothetical protein
VSAPDEGPARLVAAAARESRVAESGSKAPLTRADRRADLAAFIAACCADQTGKLFLPFGRRPHCTDAGKYEHRSFLGNVALNYPQDIDVDKLDRLIVESDTADVYMCPNPIYKERSNGSLVGAMVIHADWDGSPDDADAVLEKIRELYGFAVASGTPGHIHAYLPLAEPVNSAEATRLCKAFQAHLPPGSDPSKHTVENLLRPPGTYNHKSVAATGRPTLVEFLIRRGDMR